MPVPVSPRLSDVRPPAARSKLVSSRIGREALAGDQLDLVGAGRARDIVDLDEQPRACRRAGGSAAGSASTTTGSRTITSAEAWPTASSVQAIAIRRTVPVKSGMSKVTVAVPSAPTSTMPECSATSTEVAGGVPRREAAAVTARAQRAGHALRRVDQLAVEIAELDAELALAEIPAIGIGHLEVGEVENAEIDRGDGHIGLLARPRRWRA